MKQSLGKRIMQNRKRLGLTQEQLAEKMGVTAQAVSKWENDQSCPDISVLPSLADLFGITLDELLGRIPDVPVFTAEVVQSDECEQAEDNKHGFELSFDAGKKDAIGFALFVIFSGVLYLLSQLFAWEVSFWDILWPSALLYFGVTGLAPKFSFFRLGCLLFGGYFLVEKLGYIPHTLDSSVIFALIVVLFGGSLLMDALRKAKKPKFSMSYTDKAGQVHKGEPHNDFSYEDKGFTYNASFDDSTQTVCMQMLQHGQISTSFGDYTVDLSGIAAVSDDCAIDVSCSFGELTMQIPKRFSVRMTNSTTFADIHTVGTPEDNPSGHINLDASCSFGEIEIVYI